MQLGGLEVECRGWACVNQGGEGNLNFLEVSLNPNWLKSKTGRAVESGQVGVG